MKDLIDFIINRIRVVWHFLKHREYEIWTFNYIEDEGAGSFYYHSRHTITCSKCKISHPAHRIWIKEYSDFDIDKAKEKAMRCSATNN